MPSTPKPIQRLYRACSPSEALEPDDPRYVPCDDVRGDNVVQHYGRAFRLADPDHPQVRLFAGHRGIGKTSELKRLKRALEQPDDGDARFFVIYFDVCDMLDPNDLDFPDLLVATAGEVEQQLRDDRVPGFGGLASGLRLAWDTFAQALPDGILPKEFALNAGFASLTAELRHRPSARQSLREAIDRQASSLLGAVNDLLSQARVALQQQAWAGLVLIIDGLDKVVQRTLDDGHSSTHERLFINRAEQLAALEAHVVYTVPISLFYSPRCAFLQQVCGEISVPMGMLRLRAGAQAALDDDAPGMRVLLEILERRCAYAQVPGPQAFDDAETARYLCRLSGGHVRHLMTFVQTAALAVDALPITRAAAERAVRDYGNLLVRQVPDDYWQALRRFDQPQDHIAKDERHQQMLLLAYVFEYMNGRPWYEVNPVLRTLPRFDAGAA